jgi:hypothetical protein
MLALSAARTGQGALTKPYCVVQLLITSKNLSLLSLPTTPVASRGAL